MHWCNYAFQLVITLYIDRLPYLCLLSAPQPIHSTKKISTVRHAIHPLPYPNFSACYLFHQNLTYCLLLTTHWWSQEYRVATQYIYPSLIRTGSPYPYLITAFTLGGDGVQTHYPSLISTGMDGETLPLPLLLPHCTHFHWRDSWNLTRLRLARQLTLQCMILLGTTILFSGRDEPPDTCYALWQHC